MKEINKEKILTEDNITSYAMVIPEVFKDDNYVYLLDFEINPSYVDFNDKDYDGIVPPNEPLKLHFRTDYNLTLCRLPISEYKTNEDLENSQNILFLSTSLSFNTNRGIELYTDKPVLNTDIQVNVDNYINENFMHKNVKDLETLIGDCFKIQDIINNELVDLNVKLDERPRNLQVTSKDNYVNSDVYTLSFLNELKQKSTGEKLISDNLDFSQNLISGLFSNEDKKLYTILDLTDKFSVCIGDRYDAIEKRISTEENGEPYFMTLDFEDSKIYKSNSLDNSEIRNDILTTLNEMKNKLGSVINDFSNTNVNDKFVTLLEKAQNEFSAKEIEKEINNDLII